MFNDSEQIDCHRVVNTEQQIGLQSRNVDYQQ